MKRCGQCKNCRDLERVKSRVLACCAPVKNGVYPSQSHADDDVVKVWNDELKRLPCLAMEKADDPEVSF
jgi:hypothetical protein